MNIPSIHIPASVLLWVAGVVGVVGLVISIYWFMYRRGFNSGYAVGKKDGMEASKLVGAYCDVCRKVSPKFVAYKMFVVCEECFASISANKEMKCKFCNNPVDQCSCT